MAVPGNDPQLTAGPRRRRRTAVRVVVFVALAALTAAILAGVVTDLSSRDNTAVTYPLVDRTDKPAPAFSLPDLVNPRRSMTLTEFGGKPLVINFWASWCFPCQTEMPLLESAYRSEHGAVQFLGIDTDDKRGAAIRFLGHVHVTYPSLFMPQRGPVAVSYDLVGLPITIFIGSNGTIMGRHIGQLNGPTLRAALRLAFGPEAGARSASARVVMGTGSRGRAGRSGGHRPMGDRRGDRQVRGRAQRIRPLLTRATVLDEGRAWSLVS